MDNPMTISEAKELLGEILEIDMGDSGNVHRCVELSPKEAADITVLIEAMDEENRSLRNPMNCTKGSFKAFFGYVCRLEHVCKCEDCDEWEG
jgi:hypothetical protein